MKLQNISILTSEFESTFIKDYFHIRNYMGEFRSSIPNNDLKLKTLPNMICKYTEYKALVYKSRDM